MRKAGGTPPALARAFGETSGGGAPGRGSPLQGAEGRTWLVRRTPHGQIFDCRNRAPWTSSHSAPRRALALAPGPRGQSTKRSRRALVVHAPARAGCARPGACWLCTPRRVLAGLAPGPGSQSTKRGSARGWRGSVRDRFVCGPSPGGPAAREGGSAFFHHERVPVARNGCASEFLVACPARFYRARAGTGGARRGARVKKRRAPRAAAPSTRLRFDLSEEEQVQRRPAPSQTRAPAIGTPASRACRRRAPACRGGGASGCPLRRAGRGRRCRASRR